MAVYKTKNRRRDETRMVRESEETLTPAPTTKLDRRASWDALKHKAGEEKQAEVSEAAEVNW